jgi:hypothetical protein
MALARKIAVFWLLRIYRFSADYIHSDHKKVDERLDRFADRIVEALKRAEAGEVDEVVLVSHSVGTILTIPLLERIRKKLGPGAWERKFGVVTLGECIPTVSFHPGATAYRRQMEAAAKGREFVWLDFTTPIDGACFPLLDFYATSGVELPSTDRPRYLSPRFHTLYPPREYKRLRKNRYATHFVYLISAPKDGPYNYFRMSAGPQSLAEYAKAFKGGIK